MQVIDKKYSLHKYLPELSEKEKAGIRLYYSITEKYLEEINVKLLEVLNDHPVFGPLIKNTPKEVTEENSRISQLLQKKAIFQDEWDELIKHQIQQGIMYAKMGMEFKSWYELIILAKELLTPYLVKDINKKEELIQSISGMNQYIDIIMAVIGDAYMIAKQEEIEVEKEKIKELNEILEQKVKDRTEELESMNRELDAFTYTVSHDLRAPLRAVNGFAAILKDEYINKLDDEGLRIIDTICYNSNKMGKLIDDLLAFSKLGKKELNKSIIVMNDLVEGAQIDIEKITKHKAKIIIKPLHNIKADYGLVSQVVFNLLSNAIKYSSKKENPIIEIFSNENENEIIYSIKDNGAGFNMKYADKLFGVFQRLHSQEDFEGTGVGLAIVQRVMAKHEGRVWATGFVDEGATFNFAFKKNKPWNSV